MLYTLVAWDLVELSLAAAELGAARNMQDALAELLLAAELGGAGTVQRAVLSMLVALAELMLAAAELWIGFLAR